MATSKAKPVEAVAETAETANPKVEKKYIVNVGWLDVSGIIGAAKNTVLKKTQVEALKKLILDNEKNKSAWEIFTSSANGKNPRIIEKPADKPESQ